MKNKAIRLLASFIILLTLVGCATPHGEWEAVEAADRARFKSICASQGVDVENDESKFMSCISEQNRKLQQQADEERAAAHWTALKSTCNALGYNETDPTFKDCMLRVYQQEQAQLVQQQQAAADRQAQAQFNAQQLAAQEQAQKQIAWQNYNQMLQQNADRAVRQQAVNNETLRSMQTAPNNSMRCTTNSMGDTVYTDCD